ncbi:MAG: hypothetical protein CMF28_03190 [Kiritimatiellaceae bacterium]|nr:hypothetical protein [Kiritimatiellaceae bacterium]
MVFFKLLILFGIFHCLYGCYITQNPFADITNQRAVIKPNQSITIESEIGPVSIEYMAPTKRRLVWNGEAREFSLLKAVERAGVFAETKFEQGPIKDIYGVKYNESTVTFSSHKEYQEYLHMYVEGFGFEHCMKKQQILNCGIGRVSTGWFSRKKYFYIGIAKYQFTNEKKSP